MKGVSGSFYPPDQIVTNDDYISFFKLIAQRRKVRASVSGLSEVEMPPGAMQVSRQRSSGTALPPGYCGLR